MSTTWRCNSKLFFCETAEIFIPIFFVKSHIEETVFIINYKSKVSCICAILPCMLHVSSISCLVVWFSQYTWKIQIIKIIIKFFRFRNTYRPSLRSTRIELHQLRISEWNFFILNLSLDVSCILPLYDFCTQIRVYAELSQHQWKQISKIFIFLLISTNQCTNCHLIHNIFVETLNSHMIRSILVHQGLH